MAVETLCLMAFYIQAAGMHSVAYLYVKLTYDVLFIHAKAQQTGQASRMVRYMVDLTRDKDTQKLCWTVRVLDQICSATINASPHYPIQQPNDSLLALHEIDGSDSR